MKTRPFKNSEVGPIPEDWEVKRLGEIWTSFIVLDIDNRICQYPGP